MRLLDVINRNAVELQLPTTSREDVLRALVALLDLPEPDRVGILSLLERREDLSSTGVGSAIAIPHCRTPAVQQIHLAYGRAAAGVAWNAIDGEPVNHFFLIIAPQGGSSREYLRLLSRLAQLAKSPGINRALNEVERADEFLGVLEARDR